MDVNKILARSSR